MRFLTMIKMDENLPAGPPPPALFEAIGKLGEQAAKEGTLIDQGGLLPSAAGALVRVSGAEITVLDGPFADAGRVVGGYAMFELPSKQDAIEQARRFMQVHVDNWPGFEGECEVRQLMG